MSTQKSQVTWGIIGTGNIAHTFANGLAHSRTGKLVAVGSRTKASAEKFAKEFGVSNVHGTYEALLADPAVQAVYISTPHPTHAEWCIKAARAKKHILCEKPMTMNHAEAMVVAEAARENGVLLMEAFMYRCHPQTMRVAELIRSGAIGKVAVIKATFSFHAGYHSESRLYQNEAATRLLTRDFSRALRWGCRLRMRLRSRVTRICTLRHRQTFTPWLRRSFRERSWRSGRPALA
jgi:predicted dehydrogenase